jgi:subfamily B ATP-binding cassette protein MsbA
LNSHLNILKNLLLEQISENPFHLLKVILLLVADAMAKSILLILLGPALKSLFITSPIITVGALVPKSFHWLIPAPILTTQADVTTLLPSLILIVGCFIALIRYASNTQQAYLSHRFGSLLRLKTFRAILAYPYLTLTGRSPAAWMTILMQDILAIQNKFADILNSFLRDTIIVIVGFCTLCVADIYAAMFVMILAPLISWGMGRAGKSIASFTQMMQEELRGISSHLFAVRQRYAFVKANGGEDLEYRQFKERCQTYFTLMKSTFFTRTLFAPGMELLGFAMFSAYLYWHVSQQMLDQSHSFFLSLGALGLMVRPFRNIGEQLALISETWGQLQAHLAIFTPQGQKLNEVPVMGNHLELKKLRFSYDSGQKLSIENFTIQPGETIAIVGPSGSGKSTLMQILAGIISPDELEANFNESGIRAASSLVGQRPFLFEGSIRENLLYGLSQLPDSMLMEAMTLADISLKDSHHTFSLDTEVSSLNRVISGGQTQRLVIARAYLRPHKLLLFDEATSSVDTKSEQRLLLAACQHTKTQNSMFIAVTHRLSHLTMFDRVAYMESGQLLGFDTHKSLLLHSETYRDFCKSH